MRCQRLGGRDAFGYTVGDDTVGIYDQNSVRGFNLESAGNYRIDGHYFVKSSGVSNFFVESTAVRIGYNTFHLNLPGPWGVVDYRLRDPTLNEPSLLTGGLDEYVQPYIDLNLKHRSSTLYLLIAGGEVEIIKLGATTLVVTESLRRFVNEKRRSAS